MGFKNKNFFRDMKSTHGFNITKIIMTYFKCKMDLARAINKKYFLLRCRKDRVIPKTRHIKNYQKIDNKIFDRLQSNFIFGIISQEITEVFGTIKKLEKTIVSLESSLINNMTQRQFLRIKTRAETQFDIEFKNIKDRHINKYNEIFTSHITDRPTETLATEEEDKWLVNLTNVTIPNDVKNVLRLGEKFNPPIKSTEIPFSNYICDVESLLLHCENDETKVDIRNRLVNILTNFKSRTKHKKMLNDWEIKFLKDLKSTQKFVKEHQELIITRADKGNVTVILYKNDYLSKLTDMLSSSETYQAIDKPKTQSIQKQVNDMVTRWQNEGRITEGMGKHLRTYNGTPAKLYGLPKIHKSGTPLRPIVSSVNTPTYNLSKFLSNCINNFVGRTSTYIKNSEDFKEKISNIVLPSNYILISLDVVSLFTNVDSKLVLRLVREHWKEIKKLNGIKLTQIQFLDALKLVLENCEFTFNDLSFKQTFGSPMGSPVSPSIANLVMEYIETTVLQNSRIHTPFFYRYVDDIITAVHKDQVEDFVNLFNNFNQYIKFTVEKEENQRIPFLDVLIHHNIDGTLYTDWYHKNTWSGRYLNFKSSLPLIYKINTITVLTEKILRLSDKRFHKKNLAQLQTVLEQNGYTKRLIKKGMNKCIYKTTTIETQTEVNTQTKFVSLPYVKHLFERTKFLLKPFNIKAVGRPHIKLGNSVFSNVKDKTPIEHQSNIIYKAECDCGAVYVGQTKQYLKTRVYQHIHDATKTKDNLSALSSHIKDTKHTVSLDNFSILNKENNTNKRRVMEMILIKKHKNIINKQTDTDFLSTVYDNIL